jgi:hypothetical protein
VSEAEPELFGFFMNSTSVFETAAFGVFAANAMLKPDHFPLQTPKQRRVVSFHSTTRALGEQYPSERVTRAFRDIGKSAEFLRLSEMRNILVHRASPGFETDVDGTNQRWITAGHLEENIALTKDALDVAAEWVMAALSLLIQEARDFLVPRFESRAARLNRDA